MLTYGVFSVVLDILPACMSQNLNGFGGLAGEFSEGFYSQALLGILRKLVVADPHLLPPDAKPSGGADGQLRWGGALEYVFCMKETIREGRQ